MVSDAVSRRLTRQEQLADGTVNDIVTTIVAAIDTRALAARPISESGIIISPNWRFGNLDAFDRLENRTGRLISSDHPLKRRIQ